MPKISQIEHWELSRIQPYDNNAKLHPAEHVDQIAASIEEFDFLDPVAVDENGMLLEGHGRLLAAQVRGMASIPVIQVSGLSEAQKIAYRLAHNKLTINTGFDPEALKIDFNILNDLDFDLDLTGFEASELQLLPSEEDEGGAGKEGDRDEDELPDLEGIQPRVKPGEVWKLGRHYIACADCTVEENVRKLLGYVGDRQVSMCFADPPYGINIVATNVTVGGGEAYDIPFGGTQSLRQHSREVGGGSAYKDKHGVYPIQKQSLGSVGGAKAFGSKKSEVRGSDRASNLISVGKYASVIGDNTIETAVKSSSLYLSLFPEAMHCWWGGNYYAHTLPPSSCWIIWDKENTGNFADAELAWTNSPTAVRIFKHMWNGLMKASEKGDRRVHLTQKPLQLFIFIAEKYGKPNDLIIDPFLGSGISLIAAQKMEGDRTVVGFELSEDYCEAILQRYEALTGETVELVGRLISDTSLTSSEGEAETILGF